MENKDITEITPIPLGEVMYIEIEHYSGDSDIHKVIVSSMAEVENCVTIVFYKVV